MSLVDMRSHHDNYTMENNWSFSEPDMKLYGTSLHHIVMWGIRNAQILPISIIPYPFLHQEMRRVRHSCIIRGTYMECSFLPILNWRKDHVSNALDSLFLHSCSYWMYALKITSTLFKRYYLNNICLLLCLFFFDGSRYWVHINIKHIFKYNIKYKLS